MCQLRLGWHEEISSGTWRCLREGIQTQRWKSMDSVGEKLSGARAGDRRRGRVNYKRWWELYWWGLESHEKEFGFYPEDNGSHWGVLSRAEAKTPWEARSLFCFCFFIFSFWCPHRLAQHKHTHNTFVLAGRPSLRRLQDSPLSSLCLNVTF